MMKWTVLAVTLVLIALVFRVVPILGHMIISVDCISIGHRGLMSEIKCRSTEKVKHGLQWSRPDGVTVVLSDLKKKSDRVAQDIFRDWYRGIFDSQSENTLIINSFNPNTDAGEWMCSDGSASSLSTIKSTCNKLTNALELSLMIDCMDVAYKRKETTLRCKMHRDYGISWIRPDGQEVAACHSGYKKCTTHNKFLDKYLIAKISPEVRHLLIKSFDPKTDAGRWKCTDMTKDHESSCIKTDGSRGVIGVILNCLTPGVRGQKTYIMVAIIATLNMGFRLVRPDGQTVLSCGKNHTGCTPNVGQYTTKSVPYSTKHLFLVIKSFTPNLDSGTWTCYDGNSTLIASCFKLQYLCSIQCKHGIYELDACSCKCDKNWKGRQCDIKICLDCEHGKHLNGSCTCTCDKHWNGSRCDTYIVEDVKDVEGLAMYKIMSIVVSLILIVGVVIAVAMFRSAERKLDQNDTETPGGITNVALQSSDYSLH